MQKKVLLPQEVADGGIEYLEERNYQIVRGNSACLEKLKRDIEDCDALLLRTMECPAELINAGKKLKVISRHGVGTDNIDLAAAKKKGVVVTYTPAANSGSVAEHTMTLILASAKNLSMCDRSMRAGDFKVRDRIRGLDLENKILGIIGLGKIGRLTAEKAYRGFTMRILGYDPYVKEDELPEFIERAADLHDLFKEADFISVHIPATKDTYNLIGEKELAMMKKTAFLVNVARGSVVDEAALIAALKNNTIRGAALDVYEKEPPDPDNEVLSLDNVILTPHNASLTEEAMDRMALHAAQGIHEVLSGNAPTWEVDLSRYG